jgi:hypothetical protein
LQLLRLVRREPGTPLPSYDAPLRVFELVRAYHRGRKARYNKRVYSASDKLRMLHLLGRFELLGARSNSQYMTFARSAGRRWSGSTGNRGASWRRAAIAGGLGGA